MRQVPKCDVEPQLGFAIVLRDEQKTSAGGIIVPDTADKADMVRFFVVAASEGYVDGGTKILTKLEPGDEVIVAPNGKTKRLVRDPSGKPMEVEVAVQRLMHSPLAPEGCYLVLMTDIAARVPAAKVQPVVSGPKLAVVRGVS